MVTLQGKSRMTIEATAAELEFLILSRSDYDGVSREQVQDYQDFVSRAVRLICHAAPEFVIPCEMCRTAEALGATMVGTISVDGDITLQEVIPGAGGDERHGNA